MNKEVLQKLRDRLEIPDKISDYTVEFVTRNTLLRAMVELDVAVSGFRKSLSGAATMYSQEIHDTLKKAFGKIRK